MSIYQIEIDLYGYEFGNDLDSGRWRGAELLLAEGNTLDELLDDAAIHYADQDGGDAGEESLGDMPKDDFKALTQMIVDEYREQRRSKYPIKGGLT